MTTAAPRTLMAPDRCLRRVHHGSSTWLPSSTDRGGREVLTLPVLIILAVLWAVVLLPPLLRSRSQRTADSIVDFNYKLDVLGRTNGSVDDAAVPAPRPTSRCQLGAPGAPDRRGADDAFDRGAAIREGRRSARRDPGADALGRSSLSLLASGARLARGVGVADLRRPARGAYSRCCGRGCGACRPIASSKVRYMPELRVPELRLVSLRRSASS